MRLTEIPIIKLAIALGLFFALIQPQSSFACTCEGEASVSDMVKHADIVCTGRIIAKKITADLLPYGIKTTVVKNASENMSFMPMAVYTIKVDKLYKGKTSSDTVTILTGVNGAGCGIRFGIGEEWIIYATSNEETLFEDSKCISTNKKVYFTHSCTRTTA